MLACGTVVAGSQRAGATPGPVEIVRNEAVAEEGRTCSSDARVTACASRRPAHAPHLLGLAARDGTIAVAWVAAGNSWLTQSERRVSHLGFARFDAQLRGLGERTLEVAEVAMDVDLAAVPGGWVVAAQTGKGVELIRLEDHGGRSGASTVIAGAASPGIAATATGEVLVVHLAQVEGAWPVRATLVDRKGEARWSATIFGETVEPNFGGQVAADGGAFLVARRTNDGVSVVRVEANGAVGARHTVGTSTEYPSLAWCGASGRLVWTDFSGQGQIRGVKIDGSGRRQGYEHVLGAIPDHFNHSPVLCDGEGSRVLLGGYTGGTGVSKSLDLRRVDEARGAQAGAIPVLGGGGQLAHDPRLVRVDDRRVAAAWISVDRGTRSRIGVAIVDAPVTAAPAAVMMIAGDGE